MASVIAPASARTTSITAPACLGDSTSLRSDSFDHAGSGCVLGDSTSLSLEAFDNGSYGSSTSLSLHSFSHGDFNSRQVTELSGPTKIVLAPVEYQLGNLGLRITHLGNSASGGIFKIRVAIPHDSGTKTGGKKKKKKEKEKKREEEIREREEEGEVAATVPATRRQCDSGQRWRHQERGRRGRGEGDAPASGIAAIPSDDVVLVDGDGMKSSHSRINLCINREYKL
ncbi:hypothetical protein CKAN_01496500 [Cinnamomum micranthum f. kanehirae]|uniref:Uncharacterized protein n=1 Tax=Cinnamomum micranthum f. kanehirae TaxID=337451 RepID=A0A3S3P9I8_9MAGN|nr:hypothetical protein CKAN_01496500 [Cinnamomum micranthum f. kanehirae]